jgi:type IV fimbrial biogenesis protein FimT
MSRVNVDNSALTPAQSKDLRITIGAGGNARVCDPNVVLATDSRFCS